MSEFVSSWHFSEQEQATKLEKVGEDALKIVDRTYGDGYPHYRQCGSHELAYHNGHHARDVGNTAFKLCTLLDMDQLVRKTAQTAGYAHDLVQLKGRGVDEQESAEWLEHELSQGDIVHPALRTMGSLAILGTEPLFADGKIVGQKATQLDYPSRDAEQMAKSVASADLGEIYQPQGPFLGHQLFREINSMAPPEQLDMQKLTAFQRNQVALLDTYTYPLPQAERALTQHKPEVIAYSTGLLRQMETGAVETWNEVIERDRAFMQGL
jgi:HD superfamily phosphodiesterase